MMLPVPVTASTFSTLQSDLLGVPVYGLGHASHEQLHYQACQLH